MLIVGGLGYVGRFLALHLHKNNLASEIRLVDKVLPQLAWLAPEFAEACSQEKFMQADASREREFSPRMVFLRRFTSSGSVGAFVEMDEALHTPDVSGSSPNCRGLHISLTSPHRRIPVENI